MTSIVPRMNPLPDGIRTGPRSSHWMLNQLPVGMLDGDFFVRFVSMFQEVAGTLLDDADNIPNLVDVDVAPDRMVRFMNSWIAGGAIDPSLPPELQRRIVKSGARTLGKRGTVQGLTQFLELTSGGPAEVHDGGGVWRDGDAPDDTAWVTMRVESTGWLPVADFVTFVRDEVPAHVRAELYVGSTRVWRSDGGPLNE